MLPTDGDLPGGPLAPVLEVVAAIGDPVVRVAFQGALDPLLGLDRDLAALAQQTGQPIDQLRRAYESGREVAGALQVLAMLLGLEAAHQAAAAAAAG